MRITKVPRTTWSIAAGLICRKTILSSMRTFRIVSGNSYGQDLIIWASLLLIIRIGQAIAPCSVLSIWRVSPRIVTIYTVVIGTKARKTLHILPHWTWPGREGEVTPVFVYTNYSSAELFINGKSQGKRTKDLSIGIDSSYTEAAQKSFERQKRYRLMWMDTKYEPGTLKVVAYDKEGNAVAEEEVHTAGKPHHIELSADRNQLTADGKDLSFINVRVVDKNGNLCPDDTRQIQFKVRGAGAYRAAANGNSASLELFHLPEMKLFSGQLTAIVQTAEEPGTIYFEASAPGVKGATLELISK